MREGGREERRIKESAFCASVALIAVALVSVTAVSIPFEISGYIFNADGSACNGPTISITNLNTGETFSTATLASSNYYRVKPAPSLDDLSEGDVLQFKVSAGPESGAIDYHISVSDLNRGALHFNITFGESELKGESATEGGQSSVQTPPMPPLPQGPISTPVTTPTPEEGQTPTPTSMPAVLPSEEEKGIPGFEAAYAIMALFILFMLLKKKR